MSESNSNMIFRCPYCLNLGNDAYLEKDRDEFYCLNCSFTGNEEKIRELYSQFRSKYRNISKRITLEQQRLI